MGCILIASKLNSQFVTATGEVRDAMADRYLQQVEIRSGRSGASVSTDAKGKFSIQIQPFNRDTLFFVLTSFRTTIIPVETDGENIDLGIIYMQVNQPELQTNNLIELDDEALEAGQDDEINIGLLRASRDLLVRRAAFDFSQVFFQSTRI